MVADNSLLYKRADIQRHIDDAKVVSGILLMVLVVQPSTMNYTSEGADGTFGYSDL